MLGSSLEYRHTLLEAHLLAKVGNLVELLHDNWVHILVEEELWLDKDLAGKPVVPDNLPGVRGLEGSMVVELTL